MGYEMVATVLRAAGEVTRPQLPRGDWHEPGFMAPLQIAHFSLTNQESKNHSPLELHEHRLSDTKDSCLSENKEAGQ